MATKMKVLEKPPMPEDGHEWSPVNRDIVNGDIVRTLVEIPTHPHYGKCMYAISDGSGFGCRRSARGSAIFLYHGGWNVDEVIKFRDEHLNDKEGREFFRMDVEEIDGLLVK